MKQRLLTLSLGLALAAWLLAGPLGWGRGYANAHSQDQPEGAVYVVQSGDSLWSIAARFRVSVQDLAAANGLGAGSALNVGDRLKIPGLEALQGTLTTLVVPFGESLASLSRRSGVAPTILAQLNHLSSPGELYAGSTLVVLEQAAPPISGERSVLLPGQSLLELAAAHGVSTWDYIQTNQLSGSAAVLPGSVLSLPGAAVPISPTLGAPTQGAPVEGAEISAPPGSLPPVISQARLAPEPFVQGQAAAIELRALDGMTLAGSLAGRRIHIFSDGPGRYAGVQGIHAMTEPGLYTLEISGTLPQAAPYYGAPFAFSQGVLVTAGNYPFDPVLTVSPETIDPAVTAPEDAQWFALTAPVTPEKLWQGQFQSPALPPYNDCWPSLYGNRRSYNGSAYTYFHTGLDFCGGVGADIVAPAAGKVVFAGPLTVRGNATVIDHGWGVYSAYLHQSEILVKVGDIVKPGQVIGKVGGTGRVTGPHLHWEIWAGGVQVDPMVWLEQTFPFPEATAP